MGACKTAYEQFKPVEVNCQNCIYGGTLVGAGGIYVFKIAIQKCRITKYCDGESGCRAELFKSKEDICLNNNFSEFKHFGDNHIL